MDVLSKVSSEVHNDSRQPTFELNWMLSVLGQFMSRSGTSATEQLREKLKYVRTGLLKLAEEIKTLKGIEASIFVPRCGG